MKSSTILGLKRAMRALSRVMLAMWAKMKLCADRTTLAKWQEKGLKSAKRTSKGKGRRNWPSLNSSKRRKFLKNSQKQTNWPKEVCLKIKVWLRRCRRSWSRTLLRTCMTRRWPKCMERSIMRTKMTAMSSKLNRTRILTCNYCKRVTRRKHLTNKRKQWKTLKPCSKSLSRKLQMLTKRKLRRVKRRPMPKMGTTVGFVVTCVWSPSLRTNSALTAPNATTIRSVQAVIARIRRTRIASENTRCLRGKDHPKIVTNSSTKPTCAVASASNHLLNNPSESSIVRRARNLWSKAMQSTGAKIVRRSRSTSTSFPR